jgi:hypothetical protein
MPKLLRKYWTHDIARILQQTDSIVWELHPQYGTNIAANFNYCVIIEPAVLEEYCFILQLLREYWTSYIARVLPHSAIIASFFVPLILHEYWYELQLSSGNCTHNVTSKLQHNAIGPWLLQPQNSTHNPSSCSFSTSIETQLFPASCIVAVITLHPTVTWCSFSRCN